jgi:hypothetical protein
VVSVPFAGGLAVWLVCSATVMFSSGSLVVLLAEVLAAGAAVVLAAVLFAAVPEVVLAAELVVVTVAAFDVVLVLVPVLLVVVLVLVLLCVSVFFSVSISAADSAFLSSSSYADLSTLLFSTVLLSFAKPVPTVAIKPINKTKIKILDIIPLDSLRFKIYPPNNLTQP